MFEAICAGQDKPFDFYYVELNASQKTGLKGDILNYRLSQKPSKRYKEVY